MREYEFHIATQRGDAQEPAQDKKEDYRNCPERRSDANIPEHLADGMPTISQNDEHRLTTKPHARHHKNEQEPFKAQGERIKAHAVRIHRCTQLICKNLSPERATAQGGEHENRVDRASGFGVTVCHGLTQSRPLIITPVARMPPSRSVSQPLDADTLCFGSERGKNFAAQVLAMVDARACNRSDLQGHGMRQLRSFAIRKAMTGF